MNLKNIIKKALKESAKELLLESYYCNTYDQNGISSVQNYQKCQVLDLNDSVSDQD